MIGILKALGANNFTIRKVFLWFSVFLIGKGMIWGNVIGLSLCLLQSRFHIFKLDPQNYYIDAVPILLNPWVVIALNVATLLVAVLMLIGPSYLITKINPATSMRYE
jgi:lipoprotein-releasing system permease protein